MWHFSAALCSLFNASVSSVIQCRRNVSYNRFTSSSMFLQTFPHSPYLDIYLKGKRHLHRQRCCVHTILTAHVYLSFPYTIPYPFSHIFIVFILSLYHSSTGFEILSKSTYSINGTLTDAAHRKILTIFLFQWAYSPWRGHCYCSTDSACLLLTLSKNR